MGEVCVMGSGTERLHGFEGLKAKREEQEKEEEEKIFHLDIFGRVISG